MWLFFSFKATITLKGFFVLQTSLELQNYPSVSPLPTLWFRVVFLFAQSVALQSLSPRASDVHHKRSDCSPQKNLKPHCDFATGIGRWAHQFSPPVLRRPFHFATSSWLLASLLSSLALGSMSVSSRALFVSATLEDSLFLSLNRNRCFASPGWVNNWIIFDMLSTHRTTISVYTLAVQLICVRALLVHEGAQLPQGLLFLPNGE